MSRPDEPKTRFDLVSPGIGRISGGVVTLVLGLGTLGLGAVMDLELLRTAGLSMAMMGLILAGYGAVRIYTGIGAKTHSVKCPQCGEVNQILSDVTSFPCFNCDKSLKIGAKR